MDIVTKLLSDFISEHVFKGADISVKEHFLPIDLLVKLLKNKLFTYYAVSGVIYSKLRDNLEPVEIFDGYMMKGNKNEYHYILYHRDSPDISYLISVTEVKSKEYSILVNSCVNERVVNDYNGDDVIINESDFSLNYDFKSDKVKSVRRYYTVNVPTKEHRGLNFNTSVELRGSSIYCVFNHITLHEMGRNFMKYDVCPHLHSILYKQNGKWKLTSSYKINHETDKYKTLKLISLVDGSQLLESLEMDSPLISYAINDTPITEDKLSEEKNKLKDILINSDKYKVYLNNEILKIL
jgi:hypothetical protein